MKERMKTDSQSGLLTVMDAATFLGVSCGTLRNWLSARKLEFVKVGRLTRISRYVLHQYVATHTVPAHEAV
jgi:excisionase family DNA binding protein